MDILREVSAIREKGQACVLVTVVEKSGEGPATPGKKMLLRPDGSLTGTIGGGILEFQAGETARELLLKRENRLVRYILEEGNVQESTVTLPMACGGRVSLYFDVISGGLPVYIFGGGHVGAALSRQLAPMDFYTHVIDDRKEIYEAMDFGNERVFQDFYSYAKEADIGSDCFVIVCTPSHTNDYDVVRALIERGITPRYLGVLASQNKKNELMDILLKEFGAGKIPDSLFCPIGLDTGGPTPEEIALSIAAEMLVVQYGREGHQHMRDR